LPEHAIYQAALWVAVAYIAGSFILLNLINAPYGQLDTWSSRWWRIPQLPAWIIMESPAPLVFTTCMFVDDSPKSAAAWILFGLWSVHYYHRSYLYPFTLRGDVRLPVFIVASGAFWCALNGYLNGMWVGVFADYGAAWLTDPRFVTGVAVFIGGFILNKHSDHILRQLRASEPGESGFKIPYGGAFRYVSTPHYLGEIITWIGFAIASWSIPALLFVLMTMTNLIPRARSVHKWYRETFPDYPKDRKAIIPFLL
jgi:protein-S-isoprenylcysteine O-methyltransferase Ste14